MYSVDRFILSLYVDFRQRFAVYLSAAEAAVTNMAQQNEPVILPIKEFKNLMEELENLDDIRLYDEAKASNDVSIPIDEAFGI